MGGGIWDEHLAWDWPIDWQTLIFGPPRLEDFIIKDTWGYSDAELQQFNQYNHKALYAPVESPETIAIQCDQTLWNYVYNPGRLQVLDPCISVSGTVEEVREEADGDYHVRFRLDQ